MRFSAPLIVVADIEKSKRFYYDVLGLEVTLDFGANVTLGGIIALQTKETWLKFIAKNEKDISFKPNSAELCFEDDNFDAFAAKLKKLDIDYVHPPMEHSWGQRVLRFYDPDGHIIEVGENMPSVCKRFLAKGLSIPEIAARMDVPEDYVLEQI